MTTFTITTTKVGDADVDVHKVEEEVEMEVVDAASRIWEGEDVVTLMENSRILEVIAGHRDPTIATMPRL